MIVYLDTSVVLSILIDAANSEKAARWYSNLSASVVISDLASLEVLAVVSREYRAKRLTRTVADRAIADFDALRVHSERLSQGSKEFELAEQLVRDFSTKLAGPDALHLASAKNAGAALATFDFRLAEAARMQGVEVAELG